jgi:hypothetical protein
MPIKKAPRGAFFMGIGGESGILTASHVLKRPYVVRTGNFEGKWTSGVDLVIAKAITASLAR